LSSKAKQVLLWLMIISSAMLFVWFLQGRQNKNPQELSFDKGLTYIKDKQVKKAVVRQDLLELTTKSDEKFTSKLDASDSTRSMPRRSAPTRRSISSRLRADISGSC
jgi:hypothetical protein